MKTFLRISYDDISDLYIADYRVCTGIYKGNKHTRTFTRFSDLVTFIITYISNSFLSYVTKN